KQPEIAAKLPTAEKNPAPQVAEKNPAPQAAGKTRVPEAADRAQAQQSAENNPAPQGKAIWRVIAYTYTSRSAAERKVHEMSRRWPDLRPQVFVPAKRKDMVLVALGGRMTHEEARRLLRRAHGEGLPRDIYVQNYSE